jgi:hypothetical protein
LFEGDAQRDGHAIDARLDLAAEERLAAMLPAAAGTRDDVYPTPYFRSVVVDPYEPTLIDLDFLGIDVFFIGGSGGVEAGLGGDGPNFVIDDLTYSVAPEPAPAPLVLALMAVTSVRVARRPRFAR